MPRCFLSRVSEKRGLEKEVIQPSRTLGMVLAEATGFRIIPAATFILDSVC